MGEDMNDDADPFSIDVIGIERKPARAGFHEEGTVIVMFEIRRRRLRVEFPTAVSDDVDDADVIRTARGNLHERFMELAAQTKAWAQLPAGSTEPIGSGPDRQGDA